MNQADWFVYILKCADGSLYTGITKDLERRLACHLKGKASRYTRVRLPVTLVYQESHPDRSSASIREAAIKKLTKIQKEALLFARKP